MKEFEKIRATSKDSASAKWTPTVGEETERLLNKFFEGDESSKEKCLEETIQIMELCGNPNSESNSETGLVLGYVQSGKTLSFTTLTAMANDNGYQIVIVIAGIATNLVDQSYNRLIKDLDINNRFHRKWSVLNNLGDPSRNRAALNTIKDELANWGKADGPSEFKKTLIITVLKNATRLKHLISTLQQVSLDGVPTLIIDDEGDQASLNTKARSNSRKNKDEITLSDRDMSTIYRRMRELKSILPHHTFIQYTATPQAPLFINIMDNLSPNFIKLLTPGEKYTGGKEFFLENSFIVKKIPDDEILSDENLFLEAPESLLEAMRLFFLGVAAGYLAGDSPGNPKNRSMMVHPSRLVEDHQTYYNWVTNLKGQWKKVLLEREENDEGKVELIELFRNSYEDLKRNVSEIPPFEDILDRLGSHIQSTAIQELNSKSGNSVNWHSNYSFILVGGQAMDRGFTVEGLTVTYMPRSKGASNADTIQQRARFFGYKKDYLGYCRVFLDEENIHLYSEYVDHEEDIRSKLLDHNTSRKHLDKLERQFVLDEMFNLTRKNVLSDDTERKKFGDAWVRSNAPHDSDISIENNRSVTESFLKDIKDGLKEMPGHQKRTEDQIHLETRVPLETAYENFLKKLIFTRPSDSSNFISLKAVIASIKEELPPEGCQVYLINQGKTRVRSLDEKKDVVKNLFQGKNPRSGEVIYPGDSEIKLPESISIQIHFLDIKGTDFEQVVAVAVWIPERLSKSLIRQK